VIFFETSRVKWDETCSRLGFSCQSHFPFLFSLPDDDYSYEFDCYSPSTLSWLEVVNLKEREKSESRLRVISYFSPIVNGEWQTGCSFSRCFFLSRELTNCSVVSSRLEVSHIRIEGKSERESMNHIHSPPELLIHISRCVVFEKGDKEEELRHYHHWSRTGKSEKRRKVIMEMMMIFILSPLQDTNAGEVSLIVRIHRWLEKFKSSVWFTDFPHSPSVQISIWMEKKQMKRRGNCAWKYVQLM